MHALAVYVIFERIPASPPKQVCVIGVRAHYSFTYLTLEAFSAHHRQGSVSMRSYLHETHVTVYLNRT